MSGSTLLLCAVVLNASSGIVCCLFPRGSRAGQRISTLANVAGSFLGVWAAAGVLAGVSDGGLTLPSPVPDAQLSLRIDPLSAFFLLPVFVISAAGSVYAERYWSASEHPENSRRLRLAYGVLTASLALAVAAQDGVLLLVAWELMAVAGFLAVITEDHDKGVRAAGWIFLAATRLSAVLLLAFVVLYQTASGSFAFDLAAARRIPAGQANALFLLAVGAFGLKAGLFPLHFWLPPAHASAPSHVSAFLSGVLIKIGAYGILRVAWLFPEAPLWWGGLLLGLGTLSSFAGIVFATAQSDLKRLLAYSSIKNSGIIFQGLGLALAARSLGQAEWLLLALSGALFHVFNHALFKSLLFYAAGSAVHATGTRDLDRLGGLAKSMPRTALAFAVGAAAISALPGLNGFVSEFLIYLGLFRAGCGPSPWRAAVWVIPVLGLAGAIGLATFVKAFGAAFLGEPRSPAAERAEESGGAMTAVMAVLALSCLAVALRPGLVAVLLDDVARFWAPGLLARGPRLVDLAPLAEIGAAGAVIVAAAGVLSVPLLGRRAERHARVPTWDCGYARSSPRIQYTASSFAAVLVGLFSWILRPRRRVVKVTGLFPASQSFASEAPDVVLDRFLLPVARAVTLACSWFRLLQRGRVNAYLFYILITVVVLLLVT